MQGKGVLHRIRPASPSDPLVPLLIANAVTIILAMVEGWDFITVFLIYWFQSVTIGFFTALQILLFRGPVAPVHGGLALIPEQVRKLGMAGFFCIHYGMFHFVYLGFILGVFSMFGLQVPEVRGLLAACAFFLLTHLYSFIFYRKREEMEGLTLAQIVSRPYERILPMHLTIIAAGFIGLPAAAMGMDAGPLLLFTFLVLKTLADLWAHVRKHAHAGLPEQEREFT